MVAMMGAVLNAPLAALVAILELSRSPEIIFPAMLLVVVACLGVQTVFSYRGIFVEQLRVKGHDLFAEPGKAFLRRVGVRSVMNRSLHVADAEVTVAAAENIVASGAIWLVIEDENAYRLLATADLARNLEQLAGDEQEQATAESSAAEQSIDLLSMPAFHFNVALVDSLASLHEASEAIRSAGAEALLVIESVGYTESRPVGVLSRETLANYTGM
jgi:hypothetical protein